MGITRILDLIVIILLATILLIPRPDATVKAALPIDPERRERVAELQSELTGRPDDIDATVELANIYLDGHRPDWALATVTQALRYHPADYRLHHLRAISYADRFEGQPAFEAATQALALCEREPAPAGAATCGDATHSRLSLLVTTLEAVSKVDMKKQPYLAKERIFQTLHPTYIPRPRTAKTSAKPGAAKPEAPKPDAAKKP